MSAFGRFLNRIFKPRETIKIVPARRSRYDLAQDTIESEKHWQNADDLSANAANSPAVRGKVRRRSRLENANNSYYAGLTRGLGQDLVGTGPRLQIKIPGHDRKKIRKIERAFALWARKSGFADTLRIMHEARMRDGECFGILSSNPKLAHPVKLSIRLYEADQVTTPDLNPSDPRAVDGMRVDEFGNVEKYHFLKNHPGDSVWASTWDYVTLDAASVIHWFRADRPNQRRGVPELMPGIPLLAQLRRYCKATLGAAELASKLAGVLKTNSAAANAAPVKIEAMDEIEIPDQALLSMPMGWEPYQFKPEQPINTFGDFKAENLTEFGRPVQATRNVTTGTSKDYNYASGRLDHMLYRGAIRVERNRCVFMVLDRVAIAWFDEAMFVPELMPLFDGLPPFAEWELAWFWDGFEDIDEVKAANARSIRLQSRTSTLARECAMTGDDWEEVVEQQGIEIRKCAEEGVPNPYAAATPAVAPTQPANEEQDGTADEEELVNA